MGWGASMQYVVGVILVAFKARFSMEQGLGRLNAVRDRGKNPGGFKGALFNGTRYERAGAPQCST